MGSQDQLINLHMLLQEVIAEDPIDFEAAGLDPEAVAKLMCLHVIELNESIASNTDLSESERHLIWLSVVAKALLDNQALHMIRMRQQTKATAPSDDQVLTPLQQEAKADMQMLLNKISLSFPPKKGS